MMKNSIMWQVNIRSQFSRYWLEVYDGQSDQNPLIANYTFEDGKTPESIYSRSNYMFVKIRFQCLYNDTVRYMQPLEIRRLEQRNKWNQFKEQQYIYEKNLYKYNYPDQRYVFLCEKKISTKKFRNFFFKHGLIYIQFQNEIISLNWC